MPNNADSRSGELLFRGPTVYILDVRNRVEKKYLQRWLAASGVKDVPGNSVTLPIQDESQKLDLAELTAALAKDGSTNVVPVRISWRIPGFDTSRGLRLRQLLFGDPRSPGSVRARWILFRDASRARCFAGAPATIEELRHRFESKSVADDDGEAVALARFVVRQAGIALDLAERGLRGSRYKVPKFVAANLRADPDFRMALAGLAAAEGKPLAEYRARADAYMAEMISLPRPLFIDLKARLERFLLSLGYSGKLAVNPEEVERFRQIIREKPTLVLFTHKTYLDGLTATDIAYRNDMPLIHTFGGVNMAMPVLSTVMRGSGGIFIRRSFRDNPLYKLVLRYYISYLLEKRFPMTWAFEGTRSRIGKLAQPRFGLMKYVIDSAYNNDIADLHFVPVSTSFDLIRDVDDFVAEQAGGLKKRESLGWFLNYVRSLKQPRGEIHVNFGEPVVVHSAPDPNDHLALAKIAFEVAVQANRVTPFTLNALMCLILLAATPRCMTATELQRAIAYYVEWGRQRGIRMTGPLESGQGEDRERLEEILLRSGLYIHYDQGSEVVYGLEPSRHPTASYYRNTIVHHFLERGIIDLALLKAREQFRLSAEEVFWEETTRLRELFKFEFFYPDKQQFRSNLEAELGRIDPEWQVKLQRGGLQIQSLITRCQPLLGHAVFLPLAEAYTVVLLVLAGLQNGESIDRKTCVDRALKEGRMAYLMRRITSEASIAKTLFENGYQLAEHMNLNRATDAEVIAERKSLLREFRDLSRRMEVSRLEGLRVVDKVFDEDE